MVVEVVVEVLGPSVGWLEESTDVEPLVLVAEESVTEEGTDEGADSEPVVKSVEVPEVKV